MKETPVFTPRLSPALTSLRFFGAMAVVLYHARFLQDRPFGRLFGLGYIGVSFFFLLSGFVLGQVYLAGKSSVNVRRFLVFRFARIYPLYFVAMLLDLPHFLHTSLSGVQGIPMKAAAEIAASLLLVQSWGNRTVSLNGPSWSLSVEAFFYLLFPLVGMALWRVSRAWLLPLAALIYFGGLAAVTLTSPSGVQSYDPFRHLSTFLLGILLSRYAVLLQEDPSSLQALSRASSGVLLFAAGTIVLASYFSRYEALLQHGLLAPVFAAVILACNAGTGALFRWLRHPRLVLLGHASYAIYLLHIPVRAFCRLPLERHPAVALPVYLILLVCLGVLSFRYFEMPVRAWLIDRAGYAAGPEGVAVSAAQ